MSTRDTSQPGGQHDRRRTILIANGQPRLPSRGHRLRRNAPQRRVLYAIGAAIALLLGFELFAALFLPR